MSREWQIHQAGARLPRGGLLVGGAACTLTFVFLNGPNKQEASIVS